MIVDKIYFFASDVGNRNYIYAITLRLGVPRSAGTLYIYRPLLHLRRLSDPRIAAVTRGRGLAFCGLIQRTVPI